MIDVVVVGGSLAGLATALAMAQNGQRVLVLERGGPVRDGPVGPQAATWTGGTVAQRAHSHTLTSCGVATLRTRAPHVLDLACAAGAVLLDLTAAMPPSPPGRVPGDEELVALGCRRAVVELALRHAVADLATARTRYGVSVGGVVFDRRRGRVTGVVTGGGEEIRAGLV
ncbi:FAD-binding protein, partial [Micromonospora sp. KC207]|uniref:FAD-dependent oxidoreductase n=1 Tax=Micromonospora sp. KC207 TaxID=2530377 RepID=UPI0010518AE1